MEIQFKVSIISEYYERIIVVIISFQFDQMHLTLCRVKACKMDSIRRGLKGFNTKGWVHLKFSKKSPFLNESQCVCTYIACEVSMNLLPTQWNGSSSQFNRYHHFQSNAIAFKPRSSNSLNSRWNHRNEKYVSQNQMHSTCFAHFSLYIFDETEQYNNNNNKRMLKAWKMLITHQKSADWIVELSILLVH